MQDHDILASSATPEQNRLRIRLEDMEAKFPAVFAGSNPNTSSEDLAKQVNNVLDALERGDFEEMPLLDE